MPRKKREAEIVDPASLSREELELMPHVHDEAGACLKNITGPRCGATGARHADFFSKVL